MTNRKRALIIGCRGQLGYDLMAGLAEQFELTGVDVEELDVRESAAVDALLVKVRPEVVINAAACTDVDGCETNQELAMAVNGDGSRNVARACKKVGARLVYYSTDYVFDGTKKSPYVEEDKTDPVNFYGQSKLAGEEAIRQELEDHVILRISWLYGGHGNNFVKTMLRLGKAKLKLQEAGQKSQPLMVVSDQIGNPTWTVDVVAQTSAILKSDIRGTYHATCEGETSWFGFAGDIFEIMSMPVEVKDCTSGEYLTAAVRPKLSALENRGLKLADLNVMRNYKDALKTFLGGVPKEWLE